MTHNGNDYDGQEISHSRGILDGWDFLATVIGGIVVALLILGLHYGKG